MDDATQKLVDEARRQARILIRTGHGVEGRTLYERLADALEAAQRPPVSPQQREALIEALLKVPGSELGSAYGEPGFWPYFSDDEEDRRDAGRFVDAILAQLPVLDVEKVIARVRELEAQRDAVLALHAPIVKGAGGEKCDLCLTDDGGAELWPCATVRALTERSTT